MDWTPPRAKTPKVEEEESPPISQKHHLTHKFFASPDQKTTDAQVLVNDTLPAQTQQPNYLPTDNRQVHPDWL